MRRLRARVLGLALLALTPLAWSAPAMGAPPKKPRPAKPAKPKPGKPTPAKPTPGKPTTAPASTTEPFVEVHVVETAGTQSYIRPGSSAGIRRGSKVTIRGKEFTVVSSTSGYAVIEVGDKPPKDDERGQATTAEEQAETATELAPPRPASAFAGMWPEPVAPAASQSPKPVPLGDPERDRRWDLRFMTIAGAIVPLDRNGSFLGRAEINARLHAEPFAKPIALDLDGSVQAWAGPGLGAREGDSARPLLFVRELFVRYGRPEASFAGIGRMRYAASTLGQLDGARGRVALGSGFAVGAFGGVVPHPLSGAPSLDAQRFGVEGTYSAPQLALRPEAAVVIHGSTFDGALDERRLSGIVGLFPGRSRVGGHFEVSGFDSNNPWKASPIELTAAGLDGSVRVGALQVGARADVSQPIRSRWLASFLPSSWFCLTSPQPAATPGPETCDGRVSTRAVGTVDATVELDRVLLGAGVTTTRDLGIDSLPTMVGGFGSARVVRIARVARVELSGNYASSTFVDAWGVSGGPGVTLLHDTLDVSAYYRFGSLAYRAGPGSLQQHGFGTFLMLLPSSTLSFTLQGEAMVGDDSQMLLALFSALYRPRL